MISIACPLCRSNDFRVVATKADYSTDLTNVLCRQCGLVYTNPCLSPEELQAYYSGEFIQGRHNISTVEEARERAKRKGSEKKYSAEGLKEGLIKDSRVLEIGCSYGFLLKVVRDATGCQVQGVEPSQVSGFFAEQEFGIPVFHGSVEQYLASPNDGPYDLIIIYHVLEHLADPVADLKKLRERLADHGRLYVCVPDVTHLQEPPESFFQVPHLTSFSPWSLSQVLANAGFKPQSIQRKLMAPKNGMEIYSVKGHSYAADLGSEFQIGRGGAAVIWQIRKARMVYGLLRGIKSVLKRILPKAIIDAVSVKARGMVRTVFDR